jgi:hypothetical protein
MIMGSTAITATAGMSWVTPVSQANSSANVSTSSAALNRNRFCNAFKYAEQPPKLAPVAL